MKIIHYKHNNIPLTRLHTPQPLLVTLGKMILKIVLTPFSFLADLFSPKPNPSLFLALKAGATEAVKQNLFSLSLPEEETLFFSEIFSIFSRSPSLLQEVFFGANVQIQDRGNCYDKWKNLSQVKTRTSSHLHELGKVKGLYLSSIQGEVLFWNDGMHTRFQLEKSSLTKNSLYVINHCIDFLYYRIDGTQVGPMGRSSHTEDYPIILIRSD